MFAPKKILVPTDFSVYSNNAFNVAIDIAKQYKSGIYLLHVIDDGFQQCAVDYCINEDVLQRIYQESSKSVQDKLRQEARKFNNDTSGVEIIYDVKRGIPYEEILKEQEEKIIDLIVMVSHGKTGIIKNLMGSVVEKVIRRAKCPLLLIRN
ncbi:MAG TPA: universal stress protein [Smithella sp.]|nr:universal stress protein [Smithella sp.]